MSTDSRRYTGFEGHRVFERGSLSDVVLGAKERLDEDPHTPIGIYDDTTGVRLDIDMHGSPGEVVARLADHPMVPHEEAERAKRTGPGRPKLGVVSREVSLLPRHWEWLNRQRGGASGVLRRLVDEARRESESQDLARQALEALDRFLWDMAGDFPDFEEASRALYAKDRSRFEALTESWPEDVRDYSRERFNAWRELDLLAAKQR